jgi:hypothetical protein
MEPGALDLDIPTRRSPRYSTNPASRLANGTSGHLLTAGPATTLSTRSQALGRRTGGTRHSRTSVTETVPSASGGPGSDFIVAAYRLRRGISCRDDRIAVAPWPRSEGRAAIGCSTPRSMAPAPASCAALISARSTAKWLLVVTLGHRNISVSIVNKCPLPSVTRRLRGQPGGVSKTLRTDRR